MDQERSKKITVNIECGGEFVQTICNEGDTVQALFENGHLRGAEVTSTRLNGSPARPTTPLRDGDTVVQVPKHGQQG